MEELIDDLLRTQNDVCVIGHVCTTKRAAQEPRLRTRSHTASLLIEDILMPTTRSTMKPNLRLEKHFAHYYTHLPAIKFQAQTVVPINHRPQRTHSAYIPRPQQPSLSEPCKANAVHLAAAIRTASIDAIWQLTKTQARPDKSANGSHFRIRPRHRLGQWDAPRGLMLHSQAVWISSAASGRMMLV